MDDLTAENAPEDFDLTCWYINQRRVAELVNSVPHIAAGNDHLRHLATLSAFKDLMTDWLKITKPPSLGQLLMADVLRKGSFFTFYTNFFCRGLGEVGKALEKGKMPVPQAEAYAKLDDFRPGWKVTFRFSHDHFTSNSSWSELQGQKRLLIAGAVTHIEGNVIHAIPWIIANPVPSWTKPRSLIGSQWDNRLEVFIEQIDNFSKAHDLRRARSKKALDALKDIPEKAVKEAFAEIIGEAAVPKDWGGEKSDLFTTSLTIDSRRISTAFAFKGPAKFHPMKMKDLGANGDQIDRLFSEPADLLILQHCHEIENPVRAAMRAYAQRMGDLRTFCLIDGFDTLRILQAYGKCGL
ncbi:hypothetical protein [Sphingobium lignivorans]|uniref:Methyltransferase n=1 Tax=Sphingobium lignivorans TaxID=2735886 RepID=A0ABR6NED0_9SPHN|nr:hypothetical protein [Sphingobium lignivorans]MBB5985638.1 hypothetical protein [Sphingobium lignivorans]